MTKPNELNKREFIFVECDDAGHTNTGLYNCKDVDGQSSIIQTTTSSNDRDILTVITSEKANTTNKPAHYCTEDGFVAMSNGQDLITMGNDDLVPCQPAAARFAANAFEYQDLKDQALQPDREQIYSVIKIYVEAALSGKDDLGAVSMEFTIDRYCKKGEATCTIRAVAITRNPKNSKDSPWNAVAFLLHIVSPTEIHVEAVAKTQDLMPFIDERARRLFENQTRAVVLSEEESKIIYDLLLPSMKFLSDESHR